MTHGTDSLSSVGEFGLIERIRRIVDPVAAAADTSGDLLLGISDDAAVYRPAPGKLQLLTTDMFIEGVHFDLTFMSMKHLGWKVMTAGLSDIAAMGALPRFATVGISLPGKLTPGHVEEFYTGVAASMKEYRYAVAGGDTTASAGNMAVTVSFTGEADEKDVRFRRGAVPGDYVCVTGHLGASVAALRILQREKKRYLEAESRDEFRPELEPYAPALEKHLMPRPRLDFVKTARDGVRINSMIDISDGLASEVHHLCRESGAGARIFEHNLPVEGITQRIAAELGESPTTYALFGGEEYELLFTLSEGEFEKLQRLTGDVTVVGRILEKHEGITYEREDGTATPLVPLGWDHFGGRDGGEQQ